VSIVGIIVFAAAIAALGQDSTQAGERSQATDQGQAQEQVQNREQNQEAFQRGSQFVDEDGDGYNDNAPDQDGDGIPNGLDPDFAGARNGQGQGMPGFVDLDGDGINDNVMRNRRGGRWQHSDVGPAAGQNAQNGKPNENAAGPKGSKQNRPQDGPGYRPGNPHDTDNPGGPNRPGNPNHPSDPGRGNPSGGGNGGPPSGNQGGNPNR
ncbi:MAG TPA: hypothetical protein VKA68_14915, partial [bacterium]|nr:hypothetical protein [bacterium]